MQSARDGERITCEIDASESGSVHLRPTSLNIKHGNASNAKTMLQYLPLDPLQAKYLNGNHTDPIIHPYIYRAPRPANPTGRCRAPATLCYMYIINDEPPHAAASALHEPAPSIEVPPTVLAATSVVSHPPWPHNRAEGPASRTAQSQRPLPPPLPWTALWHPRPPPLPRTALWHPRPPPLNLRTRTAGAHRVCPAGRWSWSTRSPCPGAPRAAWVTHHTIYRGASRRPCVSSYHPPHWA